LERSLLRQLVPRRKATYRRMSQFVGSTRERLKHYGRKNKKTGCVEWVGGKNQNGYGKIWVSETQSRTTAHRAAWIVARGPIPKNKNVCHRCDNPPCIWIRHLFLGTRKQNTRDSISKGRFRRAVGEQINTAKLTPAKVRQIRKASGTNVALGKKYEVSDVTISYIRLGQIWKHVK
jgi:hypothetical protein